MSVVNQLQRHQNSIEKYSENELLHCIEELSNLPVAMLQKGRVGDAFKALVAKGTMLKQRHFSDSRPKEKFRSTNDKKSSHSQDSYEKRDRERTRKSPNSRTVTDREPSKSSKDRENSKHSNNRGNSKPSISRETLKSSTYREISKHSIDRVSSKHSKNCHGMSHKSDTSRVSRDAPEPAKEEKAVNRSNQSRKRKHDSSSSSSSSKRLKSSDDGDSGVGSPTMSSSSRSTVSPPGTSPTPSPKQESSSKDSKSWDNHRRKSHSCHKSGSDKSERSSEKSSSRDHKSSKSSRSKDRKSSKSQHQKPKSEENLKKHRNGEEGIDCNSGASFAEALEMCSVSQPATQRSSRASPAFPVVTVNTQRTTSTSKPLRFKTENANKDDGHSLLAPNVTLQPSSIERSSTLPKITIPSKPLPATNHMSAAQWRSEEECALAKVIYAKNMRTKVYSGNKTENKTTGVSKLYDICMRVLIDNIDGLEKTGGVPFEILKPVLERATSNQLFMLEYHNPYLIEDTDALWQFHCTREFRNKQREEMESFRELYMRCRDEQEAKFKAITAKLKQSNDKSLPARSAKLTFVDHMVKPPRDVARKQAKFGTSGVPSTSKPIITGTDAPPKIAVPPPPMSRVKSSGIVKKPIAPLMTKTLQILKVKGHYRR